MTAMFDIRQLTPTDAEVFRDIRLEAIQRHPTAFGTTYEEAVARSLGDFAALLDTSHVCGGFDASGLCGIGGLFTERQAKIRHKATLFTMYVRQHARGAGLADALVAQLLDHARAEYEIVQLRVGAANQTARRLYERHGFTAYGTEPRALKVDGAYHDEILMQRLLD